MVSIFVVATSNAVTLDISLYMFLTPSAPSLYKIFAARIASDPNKVYRYDCLCSAVSPCIAICTTSAISAIPFKFPLASKNALCMIPVLNVNFLNASSALDDPTLTLACLAAYSSKETIISLYELEAGLTPFSLKYCIAFPVSNEINPNSLNNSYASLDLGIKLAIIVFNDVPASDPRSPFWANNANAVLVSLKLSPTPAATAETIDKPYCISLTLVADAFAAPAKRLAASVTDKLSALKALRAVEAI
ncbi:hypothetical protein B4158_5709 [Bacillus cereus]|nr:hypothetical protein B4158_5709 [Bacillus cereus]